MHGRNTYLLGSTGVLKRARVMGHLTFFIYLVDDLNTDWYSWNSKNASSLLKSIWISPSLTPDIGALPYPNLKHCTVIGPSGHMTRSAVIGPQAIVLIFVSKIIFDFEIGPCFKSRIISISLSSSETSL